jgi:uncharacterized protein
MDTIRRGWRGRTLILLPLLLASHAVPQRGPAPVTSSLPLWEVSHGGSRLYLMASVHLVPPEVYPLDQRLYEAFDEARVVAFELDFGGQAEAAATMLRLGTYDGGRTLTDALPPVMLRDLERRLGELGAPLSAVEGMKPWLAALAVTSALVQRAGYGGEEGIDMHFYRRAVDSGKRVIGFETAEQQFRIFDGLDDIGQLAFLQYTLAVFDTAMAQMDGLLEQWRRGAMDEMAAVLTAAMVEQPVLLERLIHERNRNWIPAIEALLQGGEPAMVIVGAGHLAGDGSVVELLRARGYDVRQW